MYFKFSFYFLMFFLIVSCKSNEDSEVADNENITFSKTIPVTGNSWVVNAIDENKKIITDEGITNWTNKNNIIQTYFKTTSTGSINIGLYAKVPKGTSKIKVTLNGVSKEVEIFNLNYKEIIVGSFNLKTIGYQTLSIEALENSSSVIVDVKNVLVGGDVAKEEITFVKDDFYWGRRGPSVHLTYETPKDLDIVWFYNEITVPIDEDVVGSYYMANGFGEGYFGMQVNSETERRVLFSVWSPYETQNPKDIPEDYKIILLNKGEEVTTGEFGNEGSGGQSYKVFNWKAGNTYKFLLKGTPSVNGSTDYTAYFFAPEENKWSLIASFRRPHTTTYLKRPHSFLENFVTETGYKSRMATYGNQWVYGLDKKWHELTKATFTADATARKGARLDYAGGVEGNVFFMKNCGFFNENTEIDSKHQRKANTVSPHIDFSNLPIK